ncbi:MAG: hypothetical protein E6G71_12030 [Alphaproteobacteria bacterium]|nr:MAG: hypothetical protein E6G71_12030 [Alphaproteobacteria bacterium]
MTVVHGNRNYHVVASGAKQSMATRNRRWIASSLALLAMTAGAFLVRLIRPLSAALSPARAGRRGDRSPRRRGTGDPCSCRYVLR